LSEYNANTISPAKLANIVSDIHKGGEYATALAAKTEQCTLTHVRMCDAAHTDPRQQFRVAEMAKFT